MAGEYTRFLTQSKDKQFPYYFFILPQYNKRNSFYVKWRKTFLIGPHYAPHTHTFIRLIPKHSDQFKTIWMMLLKKGSPLRQLSPRRALRIFKQHSWFTAFHYVHFEYCQKISLWHDGVWYVDAGQMLLRNSTHRFFLSVILWKMTAQ